jgi:DNA-binding GntR family transcriptional regulator
VTKQGQRPAQRLLAVATISAAPEVAMRLDVEENTPVVLRQRLFLVEDQPVALCDSYYPADMAQGTAITEPRLIRGDALAVIEDPAGPIRRTAARSVDESTSRMPTPAEIDQLRLWATAAALRTTTMFGAFRIDPASGAQLGHQTTLVRWTANGPTAVSPASPSTL